MQRYAILLMGGRSQRFMQGDKCLTPIDGKPAFYYAFESFRKTRIFDHYIFVHRNESQKNILEKFLNNHYSPETLASIIWVLGGEERIFSVYNALQAIDKQLPAEAFVFIHDGARPMITVENIVKINKLVSIKWGVVLGHRLVDTTIAIETSHNSYIKNETSLMEDNEANRSSMVYIVEKAQRQYPQRDKLWALETPQAFYFPPLLTDYKAAIRSQRPFTDDSSISSGPIKILENSTWNLKITSPHDLEFIQFIHKIATETSIVF
ncbi:MAG: 2-C-methyl-D-erythritol 4-phosphate cytidylyltransferase [Puniceicoccales bacterium]|jgi:2-C-methyl-D-erythritol 4-phosphate cytidylyltransferase|nr:2-C-methyl-D-erythritol 4-phosphate cytidylyltransferase [Puniceicoccales bacterium]